MEKPRLGFWQIWNMSFGFLGIQFGWGLQMANMSAIYEYLGAAPDQIPILWLAAPLTGLLVQPDHRPHERPHLGPRSAAGVRTSWSARCSARSRSSLMPNVLRAVDGGGPALDLDASINISMEPFRAFVADMLPERSAHAAASRCRASSSAWARWWPPRCPGC